MQGQLITASQPHIQLIAGEAPAEALVFYDAAASLLADHFGPEWEQYRNRLGIQTERVQAQRVILPPGVARLAGNDEFGIVSLGEGSVPELHRAGAAITRAALEAKAGTIMVECAGSLSSDQLQALTYGLILGAYRHPRVLGASADQAAQEQSEPLQVFLPAPAESGEAEARAQVQKVIDRAQGGARATWHAREWAATPSNFKNPAWLAAQAQQMVEQLPPAAQKHITLTSYDEQWLKDHGFGGILAVGEGSTTPPRLLVVEYRPTDEQPVVLVGKGITYDTGGLALKPREGMVSMKTDMSGAAIVVQAVLSAAASGGKKPVVAIAALAENTMGAGSYRPGDVLTMVDGTTVEIGNTDAEGRLVLADAMAWAASELSPAAIIDVATLTGAITLGLGKQYSAVYSRDTELVAALQAASQRAAERMWHMPLVADYAEAMASEVADVNHIATDSSVGAGSITAALFLERFAHGVPWVHFDIAGTGRSEGDYFDGRKGATGVMARTLFEFLMD